MRQKAQNILAGSLIFRFFAAITRFLSAQWNGSALMGAYLRGAKDASYKSSVITRLLSWLRNAQIRVFRVLRLDKLLRGSIFTYPWAWCCAALALAPLLPTMPAVALAAAVMGCVFLRLGTDAGFSAPARPVNKFIIMYIAVSGAGVVMSVSPGDSLAGGALLIFCAFFAVITQYSLIMRRDIYRAIGFLVFGGFLVSCHGMLQYVRGVTGASSWLDSEMFMGMTRVYATLDNPNVLAQYLLLVIPFAAAGVVRAKGTLTRFLFTAALGAMLLCMALTISRGGWLGLIVAAAVFLVMLDRRCILLGVAALIALYFLLPDAILHRLLSIGDLRDSSTSYRLSIWFGTISMLRDYWFIGVGPGTAVFNRIYPLYAYSAAYTQHSHNLFLQIVCDAGITALIAFALGILSLLRSLARGTGKLSPRENKGFAGTPELTDKTARVYRIAAISAVVGFLVQGVTDYSFYNYRVALMFWAVVGLSAALSRATLDAPEDMEGTP